MQISLLTPLRGLAAALAVQTFLSIAAYGQDDLVKNPGFESGTLEPWEWYVAGDAKAKGEIDSREKHGGASSYLIRNESKLEPNVYGQLRQYVNGLKPNTTYRLTVWVKGDNVSGGQIALGPEWKTLQRLPEGSFDWTEVEKEFTTGDSPEKYEVVFVIGSETEALWLDDVKIEENGKAGAAVFDPSVWPGLAAAAGFYPVFARQDLAGLPVVSLRADGSPLFGGDVRISGDSQSLFF